MELILKKLKNFWNDHELIQIEAKTIEEPRYLLIGKIDGVSWSAIITYRDDIIRMISVRRSRIEEVKLYEED